MPKKIMKIKIVFNNSTSAARIRLFTNWLDAHEPIKPAEISAKESGLGLTVNAMFDLSKGYKVYSFLKKHNKNDEFFVTIEG